MAVPPYVPPGPGEPLDAVQLALKKLIADLLVADVLAEIAAADADQHDQHEAPTHAPQERRST